MLAPGGVVNERYQLTANRPPVDVCAKRHLFNGHVFSYLGASDL